MYELAGDRFGNVRVLLQSPANQPFCAAVLAGIHPGHVFVDDASQPRTVLVTRDDAWCFLVGDPDNEGFNRAVNRAIWDREIVSPKASVLLFTCRPEEWEGNLGDVFAPRQPMLARNSKPCIDCPSGKPCWSAWRKADSVLPLLDGIGRGS